MNNDGFDQRESAFDTLAYGESLNFSREEFVIPTEHGRDDFEKPSDGFSIQSFKYVLPNKCFERCGRKQMNTLFFKMKLHKTPKKEGRQKELMKEFIIINYSEMQMDETILERDCVVESMLRKGIRFGDKNYNVVGCSNSQVQKKSFVFMKGTRGDCDTTIKQFIPNIEELEARKGVAKRVKYTGLLFSGCHQIVQLPSSCHIQKINDVEGGNEREEFNFTDGCGVISLKLAKEILEENKTLCKAWNGTIPSVWQIRFYGSINGVGCLCKGVLVVDYSDEHHSVLKFRDSLIKIKNVSISDNIDWLGIIETNHKGKTGSLNKQVVTLLSQTIPKRILLQIQKEYIDMILKSRSDAIEAFKTSVLTRQWSVMEGLLRKRGFKFLPKNYTSLVKQIEEHFVKLCTKEDMEGFVTDRIQIPIACSRLLFGAAFPEKLHNFIKEGECIVFKDNGYHEGLVIVNRSPSYSPGDIRVLKAVKPPSNVDVYSMRNVIFFGTKGKRPDPDKMSGGDLDGDKYLVIWDRRLLDYADEIKREEPIDFSKLAKPNRNARKNNEDWLSYIAKWENSLLSQIDNCFYNIAEIYGVKSENCKEICEIFSRAVDQVPADIDRLQKIIAKIGSTPKRYHQFIHNPMNMKPVWEIMRDQIIEALEELKKRDRFPSEKEWMDFSSSLIYRDQDEIDDLLSCLEVKELLNRKEINQTKSSWYRICEGKRAVLTQPIQNVNCSYDCDDSDCTNTHRTDPEFYKQVWRTHCEEVISDFVKDKKEEYVQVIFQIKSHQKLLDKKNSMEKEANDQYEEELKSFEKRKAPINQVLGTFTKIEELFQSTGRLRIQLFKPVEFSEKVSKFFGINSIDPEKQYLESKIRIKEIELINLYNRILLEINDMNHQFGIQKLLMVKFDSIDHFYEVNQTTNLTYYKMFRQRATKSMKKAEERLKSKRPKVQIVLSCKENVDRLIAILDSSLQSYEDEQKQNQSKRYEIDQKINGKMREFKKSKSEFIHQNEILRKLMELKALYHITNRMTIPNEVLEKTTDALVEPDLLRDMPKSSYVLDQLMLETKITNKIWLSIQEMVNQRIVSVKSSTHKLHLQNDCIKIELERLKKERTVYLDNINKLAGNIDDKKAEIQENRKLQENVYDKCKHDEAIKRYHDVDIEQLGSFDLALSALYHEINFCFDLEMVTNKERTAASTALKLSLRRERNRCERDLSEHALPVFRKRAKILDALRKHDAVIVVAKTGSGKSTQVPQYLADDLHHVLPIGARFPSVACTQPRRVACIRIAERVSMEYAGAVGLPPPKGTKKKETSIMGKRRVAAYPLYASLSENDQDRALDDNDRVGFDVAGPHAKTKRKNDVSADKNLQEIKGTPGEVGQWIGYQIGSKGKSKEDRMKSKRVCKNTRVHFVTEGLLLQKLKSGGNQSQYNCIIIDEAHERGRDTDLLLAHLHEILKISKNEESKLNFKIVIMSASIDKFAFSRYFDNCPIVECKGRMHGVTITYIEPQDIKDNAGNRNDDDEDDDDDGSDSDYDSSWETESAVSSIGEEKATVKEVKKSQKGSFLIIKCAVDTIFNIILNDEEPGDILVFLPGQNEIHNCVEMINERANRENSSEECMHNTKKVVCCTNIAETSLTIPGVKYVLDSGKAKKIKYNHKLRVTALKLCDISQASAKQRKGRAGRVAPGSCYRLYSKEHHDKEMEKFDEPEMKQAPVDELYLYTLDVLKGLEKIELMPDAKIELEVIKNAKNRLLNLNYIMEEDSYDDEVKITEDGKFALSLSGDVALEGAKMILEAKKYDVVYDTLYLAVLLSLNIYDRDNTNKEEQAKYTDELGDHLTILNLYKHFNHKFHSDRMGKDIARQWCSKTGLNAGILEQVPKLASRVYESIKRENKYNIADIFKRQKEEERKTLLKRSGRSRKFAVLAPCLIENEKRENIMKAVVAGYFHNISFVNDPKYIKSGYSLATPENYGDVSGSSIWRQADLLKLKLSKESTLNELGDSLQNTSMIYGSLFEPCNGLVLMQIASRVKPEWITECSSQKWRSSIYLDSGDYNGYIQRHYEKNIGTIILSQLIKEKKIKGVEEVTNAKVQTFFDIGELRIYGSYKEINAAKEELEEKLDYLKAKLVSEDNKENIPKASNNENKQCVIESGLMINAVSNLPRPQIFHTIDEITSTTIMIHKGINGESQIKNGIKMIRENYLSEDIKSVWEEPNICFFTNSGLARIEFSRKDVANEFFAQLKARLSGIFSYETKCFFDKHLQLNVMKTELYPSVMEIAEDYPYVKVKTVAKGKLEIFKIELVKKAPRNADRQIDEFLERLAEEKVFGSVLIENIEDIEFGVKEYVFWMIKNKYVDIIQEKWNILVKWKKYPRMIVEIFGEYSARERAASFIRGQILIIKKDVANPSISTKTYNRKIKLDSRNKLGLVLPKINELRKNNKNIIMTVEFGKSGGSSTIPVVHLICESASDGRIAKKAIMECIEADEGLEEIGAEPRCCTCNCKVYLRKSSKQKKREKAELKSAVNEKGSLRKLRTKDENEEGFPRGFRLMLCGDTYCKKCLEFVIKEQLEIQRAKKVHEQVECYICNQIILIKDIRIFYENVQEDIFNTAFRNYLFASGHSRCSKIKHVDQCGNCRTLLVLYESDYGIYRCSNKECRFLFCCMCHKRIMHGNQIDMKYHFENCEEIIQPDRITLRSYSNMQNMPTRYAELNTRRSGAHTAYNTCSWNYS